MRLAIKTLQAIEEALYKDQGAKFRGLLKELMPLAGDAYSTEEDDWRDHLGASLIGRECDRELYYSFHWATLKRFDGRMIRLFNRGHLEEPRFIALLMMIGCQVWSLDANGKQFKIKGYRGHFGGSMDSVVQGIPDIPNEPILTEYKTHKDKSFTKVADTGVMNAKWEHFVQMQVYMGKNNLTWALYCAVNKDTDAIHMELVHFDPIIYAKYCDERPARIIDAVEPPKRINESPGWWKCKMCDQIGVCHRGELPARNCRTCDYSRVEDEGKWSCVHPDHGYELTPERQRIGCDFYELNTAF